jgi:predicted ATP-dependent endonuclease of OLD family
LFYELIFGSPGIDLFLIDEPEISLHVEWQRSFLSDLQKVQKLTGCRFLVATHSPQIINNRRDLAVALDGGVGD